MKFSFLGNYTIDIIAKEYAKATKDEIFISGYGQYFFDLMNENSDYYNFKSDFSILLLDGNSLLENKSLEEAKSHILELVELFEKGSSGYLVLGNIFLDSAVNSVKNYNSEDSCKNLQMQLNRFLTEISKENNRVFILDILSLIEEYGVRNIYDNSMWQYGKIRFNKLGHKIIAEEILMLVNAIKNQTKKCLVLDLDNTLWGGVIGEDGMSGIQLGPDGIGECFLKFQKRIKEISEKGIILCLCSKNNLADAKEVFDSHEFCYLKWDDFIVHKVDWNRKDKNLAEMAEILNIGEDSLVFIDDNPVERAIVRENTKVTVPEFPELPEDLENFIKTVDKKYFAKFSVTKEDKEKTFQYKQNSEREKIRTKVDNIDEFIKDLGIKIVIEKAIEDNVARIAQMTQKTNQFNLTTKRYTEQEIRDMMNAEGNKYLIYAGKVEDKFGSYGIVVQIILEKTASGNYEIDSFLMSCRVIGRKIEDYFLDNVLRLTNNEVVTARYIPTEKNIMVKNKYEELGFSLVEAKENGEKIYKSSSFRSLDDKISIKYE